MLMSDAAAGAASDLLWRNWRDGTRLPYLPPDLRPQSRGDGYRVQALLERRSDAPLSGWKIAATSAAGQAHLDVDGPLAGRLIRDIMREDGADIPLRDNIMCVAEAEFAFRMGRDLPPRAEPYTRGDVLAAADTLHPAIEIPDSRYEDFTKVGAAQLIADDACAYLFVLGPAASPEWRDVDLAAYRMTGRVTGASGTVEREGAGANVLGDPVRAMAWLVNELSSMGITLRSGEIVTTGTCLTPLPIAVGDAVSADFGRLGTVACRIV